MKNSKKLTPLNFTFYCIFKKEFFVGRVVLWFKKLILCCWDPHRGGSVPQYLFYSSIYHNMSFPF